MVSEKQASQKRPLHYIFTSVPQHYDIVNRIFTAGFDERWRRLTAQICLGSQPGRIMDLCCGTGDLSSWLIRLAPANTELIGLDYSLPMLELAKEKTKRFSLETDPWFIHGDVGDLPFPDDYFDCIGISFAFRNLTYNNPRTGRYLSEIVRVLKPGGQFVIVESSQPPNLIIRKCVHAYLQLFVSRLGYWISRNRPAYKYLAESARHFYSADELVDLLTDAGFKQITIKRLLFGAVAIHIAVK